MDIRDYEYIVAIAEKGGISKAADHLFITQSALTKFLQRTEQKLGMELFVRKGKQFLLTEAGRTAAASVCNGKIQNPFWLQYGANQ